MVLDSDKFMELMDSIINPIENGYLLEDIIKDIFSYHGCLPILLANGLVTIDSKKASRRSHRITITVSFPNSILSVYDVTSITDTIIQRKSVVDGILDVLSFFDLDHRLQFGGWSSIDSRSKFLERYIGGIATTN